MFQQTFQAQAMLLATLPTLVELLSAGDFVFLFFDLPLMKISPLTKADMHLSSSDRGWNAPGTHPRWVGVHPSA
jgi:hypothetical protein